MADIEVTARDGVQVIRIARPAKKNALTDAMYAAMADAIEGGDCDAGVACHVLAGVPGVFCAGNDINDFLAGSAGAGGLPSSVLRFVRLLARTAKPLIAAVDGPAIGVGTTLLLHCDLVYATPQATFATPFLDLGLVPEAASSLLAPRLMGYARAFELLVLGETLTAEQALAAGLVNRVVAPADVEATAMAAGRRLANKPQEALRLARALLRGDAAGIDARMLEEANLFRDRLGSPEARLAFRAFLDRRPKG